MGNSGKTIWENVIIFILFGVILCFLTPIVQNIFFKAQLKSAKSATEEAIHLTNTLYGELNILRDVSLPFTLSFNKNGTYNLYEGTTKISDNQLLEKGKAPTSGSVILDKDAEVTVTNMTFGKVICIKQYKKDVECALKKETTKSKDE